MPIIVPKSFVSESWRIEGIGTIIEADINAHNDLINLPSLRVADIENFVLRINGKPLRDKIGMNVYIGQHVPILGGPEIKEKLTILLDEISNNLWNPFEAHVKYEILHPFMDGNGRSGRAIWAWHMIKDGQNPFDISFLHRFYYQSLDNSRH